MPGCTKRYTDPSSLRKHVKNHAIKSQASAKKKINKEATMTTKKVSINTINCPAQKYSNIELSIVDDKNYLQPVKCNDDILFDPITGFDVLKEEATKDVGSNTMDLMEISKCILGIEDERTLFNNYELIDEKSFSNGESNFRADSNDEFVSIEAIKKFLTDPSIKYVDLTLQDHLNVDYYNSF